MGITHIKGKKSREKSPPSLDFSQENQKIKARPRHASSLEFAPKLLREKNATFKTTDFSNYRTASDSNFSTKRAR